MEKALRLTLTMNAAGSATAFLRGLRGEAAKASDGLKAARDRVSQLQAVARDGRGLKALETQLGNTRQGLREAQVEAQRLGRAHAATETPTRALTRAFEAARAKVNRLEAAEQQQAAALQTVRQRLDAAGYSTRRLSGLETQLARDTRQANQALEQQQKKLDEVARRQARMNGARQRYDRTQALAGSMQGAGTSAIAGGAAMAAPLALATRQAMAFEEAMADVRKVVDFPTPASFRQMSAEVLDLTTRLPVASEELAAILAQGARSGVARNELLAFTEDAAKMAVAFDISSEQAGAQMATWRTALGLTQPQVVALADRVNALTNAYGGSADAVSEMITRVGPLGDIAGAGGPALAALAQVMNSVGVESEVGATGIKNLLLGLTKGEAATRRQRQAFSALGMDASQMAVRMQTDASGAITSVLEAVAKLPRERGLAILSQLFGTESVAAIAPLLSQLDLVKRNLGAVGDASFYAGSMTEEYRRRAETTANSQQLGINALKAMATEVGGNFLPTIRAAWDGVARFSNRLRGFAQAHPGVVKVVAALVAIIAGGLLVFGGLALAISAVLGPFALLQLTLVQSGLLFGPVVKGLKLAAGATRLFNLALLANPIVLISAAIIAAVALVAYMVYRNWGRIGPWLGRLWSGITQAVGVALNVLKTLFLNFHPLGLIIKNWQPIVGFFRASGRLLTELVGLALDSILFLLMRFTPVGMIVRNWGPITGLVQQILQGAAGAIDRGLALAGSLLLNFTPLGLIIRNWQPLLGYATGLWNQLRSIVATGIAALRSALAGFNPLPIFRAAFNQLFNWLGGLPGRFMRFGADMINGLTRGVQSRRAQVQAATADAARAGETGVRRQAGIRSPSTVFARLGVYTMEGLALGIRQGSGRAANQMRLATAAVAAAAALSSPAMALAAVPPLSPSPQITPALATPGAAGGPRGGAVGGPQPPMQVTVNIYAAPGQDEHRLAELVERKFREVLGSGGGAAYADDSRSWGAG